MKCLALAMCLLVIAACKQQEAPKPDEKKSTATGTVTPPPYPQPPPSPPIDYGNEEQNESEVDEASGCSSSTCRDPGTLSINVDGTASQVLAVSPQTAKSWTITVKSSRYEDRRFLLDITSDGPSLNVTQNQSSSVIVAWTPGGTTTQGQLRIRVRDEMRCEKEGTGGDCSDFSESNANDEELTLPWSTDGTIPNLGTGGNSSNAAVSIGLKILAGLLGLDIGPSTFYGTNNGVVGGGIANGNVNNNFNTALNNGQNTNNTLNTTNTNTNGVNNTGVGVCSVSNCAACTEFQCSDKGCTWDALNNQCR